MVREYEREGYPLSDMDDKCPQDESFVAANHSVIDVDEFCRKIEVPERASAHQLPRDHAS
jgi:hypothetical protein